MTEAAVTRSIDAHRVKWGEPDLVVRAPGRVNLIGEHTDYNDGFCLPMALPFDTVISTSRADCSTIEIESEGFGPVTIDPAARNHGLPEWALHLGGVAWLLHELGVAAGGWRATIATDVPAGAGLSSSAALEVAAIKTVLALSDIEWEPVEIAKLAQRVENEVVGLPSGIMDQFISAGAVRGFAGLLDCRALSLTPVPMPTGVKIAVIDTGTRRDLATAAYAERRAACERAARALGVAALRDTTPVDLPALPPSMQVERRRACHVVSENDRTQAAVAAMRTDEPHELGRLMSASHRSLRDDFEVSSAALDQLVDIAKAAPGCLGARMTGGGFGGCAVAIVTGDKTDDFTAAVLSGYSCDDLTARVWICEPSAGTSVIAPIDW